MNGYKQTNPAVICSYLLHFWAQYIQPHFQIEETLLLPEMKADNPVILRLQEEHKEIRDIVNVIQNGMQNKNLTELLQSFADKLTGHIRFEENEAFPFAEKTIPEETITRIDNTLHSTFQQLDDPWTPEFWKLKKP